MGGQIFVFVVADRRLKGVVDAAPAPAAAPAVDN